MRTLNKAAAEAISRLHVDGVHACTDITGFGLAGHASEMAAGSNVTIEIDATSLPLIPGVLDIAAKNRSGGMTTNKDHFGPGIEFGRDVSEDLRDVIFDPQTSGGLLVSVAAESADEVMESLSKPEFRPFSLDVARPPASEACFRVIAIINVSRPSWDPMEPGTPGTLVLRDTI